MEPISIVLILIILVVAGTAIFFTCSRGEKANSNTLFSDALGAILQGDNENAIKLLRKVVKLDTDNTDAYLQLGNLLRATNPQQAAKIHQSLTVRPKLQKNTSIAIHHALALDYSEVNNHERAKKEAEMILKFDKKHLWAKRFLYQIAEQQRDWSTALQLSKNIQRQTGESSSQRNATIHIQDGIDQMMKGDNNKARKCFQDAIKDNPDDSLPYRYIGNIYAENNNHKRAVKHWEDYLIRDENAEYYKKIESALFDAGKFSDTEKSFRRILAENPKSQKAAYKLAKLLQEKADSKGALEIIEESISRLDKAIPARLLKIKLSLSNADSRDIANQIDDIIDIYDSFSEE